MCDIKKTCSPFKRISSKTDYIEEFKKLQMKRFESFDSNQTCKINIYEPSHQKTIDNIISKGMALRVARCHICECLYVPSRVSMSKVRKHPIVNKQKQRSWPCNLIMSSPPNSYQLKLSQKWCKSLIVCNTSL